jgi:hypothetical protein
LIPPGGPQVTRGKDRPAPAVGQFRSIERSEHRHADDRFQSTAALWATSARMWRVYKAVAHGFAALIGIRCRREVNRRPGRPGAADPYAQGATMRRRGALRRCHRGIALLGPKRGQSDLDIVFAHKRSCDAAGDLPGQLPLSTVVIQPMAPTTAIVSQQRQHLQGFPTVPR